MEIINEESSIELVDDHYKKIDKTIYEQYKFDLDSVTDKKIKQKYSSIFNPITLFINGIKKVSNYPVMKKFLLVGFMLSAVFIEYAVSTIVAATKIDDKNFVTKNKEYLIADVPNLTVEDYLEYEKQENVNYILPGNSLAHLEIYYDEWYQTAEHNQYIYGSIASINMISEQDIVLGRMPENDYEIVCDKFLIETLIEDSVVSYPKYFNMTSVEQFLNKEVNASDYMHSFKIVGFVDKSSPSFYVAESEIINILANMTEGEEFALKSFNASNTIEYLTDSRLFDYTLLEDEIELESGKMPENDYEVIVNSKYKDTMPLNETIDTKVNNTELKVVGYYSSKENYCYYLVSNNTIKYNLIYNAEQITVYSSNKEATIAEFIANNVVLEDSYTTEKNEYIEEREEKVKNALIAAVIILAISLVEIVLMIRASFLSRIKEVGLYRAIGMKKKDIYKMFLGEISAITSTAGLFGILIMSYILYQLSYVKTFAEVMEFSPFVVLISIAITYIFNIIVGLIPVAQTIRKTPAEIMSRSDVE